MDKPAILKALLAGEMDSPALDGWYSLATERRQAVRQEIASDFAQKLAQAASELPMSYATERQSQTIEKLRKHYGGMWIIQEPGISLARAIRQAAQ